MTDNWVKKDKIAERQSIYLHVFIYPLLFIGATTLCHIQFNYVTDLSYGTRKQIKVKDDKIFDLYF